MKNKKVIAIALVVLTLLIIAVAPSLAQGTVSNIPAAITANVGTAFTYQGYLTDGGSPANGDYDFEFNLYDDPDNGTLFGTDTEADKTVTDGLFTVRLDFGEVYTGTARYLEIGVRPGNSDDAYTMLDPRQELTPVPYALALPGLWTQQTAGTPNIIGGYSDNEIWEGLVGATISGGGADGDLNYVTDNYGTVGGGIGNQSGVGDGTGAYATVGGGRGNVAAGGESVVGGGWDNHAFNTNSTVGGGGRNYANFAFTTVSGGFRNTASNLYATVGGGQDNTASGESSTVGGGEDNTASADNATVGGGTSNAAGANSATVSGGSANTAIGPAATVGGGQSNNASGTRATIPGGFSASASHYGEVAYAGGGFDNVAGTAQTSIFVLRNMTSDATLTELFLDGTVSQLTIANGRTVTFDVLVAGRSSNGDSIGCNFQGVIENVSNTVSFVATPGKLCHKDVSAWDVTVVADNTNNALIIQVTGEDGKNIRWVATVRTVEVQWPVTATEGD